VEYLQWVELQRNGQEYRATTGFFAKVKTAIYWRFGEVPHTNNKALALGLVRFKERNG